MEFESRSEFIDVVTAPFRTHSYRFTVLKKGMIPDYVSEHLVRERIFRLKTRTPTAQTRVVSRSTKDAIINNRVHI